MRTLLLTLLLVPMMSFGQNVNIPDANFKNYLVNNSAINTNGDSEIQVSEASVFTGWINVHNKNISDLTGIEEFTSLIYLYCYDNQLTSLDVSNCSALTYLYCNDNQLIYLDVSNCSNLILLDCSNNDLVCLNVKNGNNTNFTQFFYANNNSNLTCIEVDDVNFSTNNWTNIDSQTSFSSDCGNSGCSLNINDLNKAPKKLIQIVDLLGRETPFKPNTPLLYIYNDGTVERKMIIKE